MPAAKGLGRRAALVAIVVLAVVGAVNAGEAGRQIEKFQQVALDGPNQLTPDPAQIPAPPIPASTPSTPETGSTIGETPHGSGIALDVLRQRADAARRVAQDRISALAPLVIGWLVLVLLAVIAMAVVCGIFLAVLISQILQWVVVGFLAVVSVAAICGVLLAAVVWSVSFARTSGVVGRFLKLIFGLFSILTLAVMCLLLWVAHILRDRTADRSVEIILPKQDAIVKAPWYSGIIRTMLAYAAIKAT